MALPLLEKIRVLCADVERRRIAVANCYAATAPTDNSANNNNNAGGADENASTDATSKSRTYQQHHQQHENVPMIRDHFVLRQCSAARDASNAVLDALDSEELERLAATFAAEQGLLPAAQLSAAHKAVESFDLAAAHLREYHRQYAQSPFSLPQLERPGDRDVNKVRRGLFSGPERRGRAVDLTLAFKCLSEFLESSSSNNNNNNNNSSTSSSVVVVVVQQMDLDISYPAFVCDPIGECGRIAAVRKLIRPHSERYRDALRAAVSSLESFVQRTKPLTAEGEVADVQSKCNTVAAQAAAKLRQGASSSSSSCSSSWTSSAAQQLLSCFSTRIRDAWKDVAAAAGLVGNTAQQQAISSANLKKLVQLLANNDNTVRQDIVDTMLLEERLFLLCDNCIGESVLAASSDHIRRVALRTTSEEQQDEEDDETRFQQDFFSAFYAKKPLSDRVELTVTSVDNADLMLSKTATDGAAAASNNNHHVTDANAEQQEEDERLKNPKNFPVDALGNPIPVWLYKLHGLSKKFFCEVCGFAYEGEKVYTQHFAEPRHERGLERLGITLTPQNAEAFRLIPTRAGALATQRKLEEGEEQARRRLRGDDEELEDATGNIATRAQMRTF